MGSVTQLPDKAALAAFGAPPELTWIPISKLHADSAYQRGIGSRGSQKLIDRIADHFRWALFGAVTVVAVDDGYRIIDGQHRCAAARQRAIAQVPALVVQADGVEEEAKLFVAANLNRVALTPLALHHARLAAGDKLARMAAGAAKDAGVAIVRYPKTRRLMKRGETMAAGAIVTGCRTYGATAVTAALCIVARTWPSPGEILAQRIRAVLEAVARLGAKGAGEAVDALGARALDNASDDAFDLGLSKAKAMSGLVMRQARGLVKRSDR